MTLFQARRSLALSINRSFYFGWAMLFVAGLGIFASGPGQSHTFGVFLGPISADLGLSRTTIAGAYGAATLAAAFGLPVLGRLVDRFGCARAMFAVVLLLGSACMAFSLVGGALWLGIGFAALRFFGQGAMMLTSANLVAQWFDRRRGVALSLMALGWAGTMAVHPPLARWLVEQAGWREAWILLGLSTWLVMLPPVILLLHSRPESLGLRPDGAAAPAASAGGGDAVTGLSLTAALRTGAFHIIAAGVFAIAMLVTTLHFFQVSIFEAQGVSAAAATWIFPVSAVTMVAAMPLVGRMLDRFPTRAMFAGGLFTTAAALAAAALVQDLPTALLYGVVFGLANAVGMTMLPYMWPRYFGRAHLGSIQGVGQMVGVVAAALGPMPLAVAGDLASDYRSTLLALAVIPIACAILALFLRTPAGLQPRQ